MVLKRKKSLLIFIIFVVIIIAGIAIYNAANNFIKEKNRDDKITNLLIIQGKVKTINGISEINGNTDSYKGKKISELDDEALKSKLISSGIRDDQFENYYLLTCSDFESMGILSDLKNPKDNEYVASYKDEEVVYVDGIDINGEQKYKITEMLQDKNSPAWKLYDEIGD